MSAHTQTYKQVRSTHTHACRANRRFYFITPYTRIHQGPLALLSLLCLGYWPVIARYLCLITPTHALARRSDAVEKVSQNQFNTSSFGCHEKATKKVAQSLRREFVRFNLNRSKFYHPSNSDFKRRMVIKWMGKRQRAIVLGMAQLSIYRYFKSTL